MNLLILGDVMGSAGRKALSSKLPNLIKINKIDFVIVNGENASDDGKGITQEIAEDFFRIGVDVITSGNHIWDKKDITNFLRVVENIQDMLGMKDKTVTKTTTQLEATATRKLLDEINEEEQQLKGTQTKIEAKTSTDET